MNFEKLVCDLPRRTYGAFTLVAFVREDHRARYIGTVLVTGPEMTDVRSEVLVSAEDEDAAAQAALDEVQRRIRAGEIGASTAFGRRPAT